MDKYDKHYNQMITFTIIRELWKIFKEKRPSNEFYNRVNMRLEEYSDFVNVRDSAPNIKDKAKILSKAIGIKEEFFIGTEAIKLQGITEKEWHLYFGTKSDINAKKNKLNAQEKRKAIREANEFEERFILKLKQMGQEDITYIRKNEDIYKIFYWITKGKRCDINISGLEFENLIDTLSEVTITRLEKLDIETFDRYLNTLEEAIEKVKAVKIYSKYKKH